MARRVFFSFHYDRDAWRAAQVRNSNKVAKSDEYEFIDGADWEEVKGKGDAAIEKWILDQLKGTSVTVVLIGAESAERDWIDFEIRESWKKGNALLGVRIHNVKDADGKTDVAGANPLDAVVLKGGTALSSVFRTYDWVTDDGYENFGKWIEQAFSIREKYAGETELKSSIAVKASAAAVISNPSKPWATEPARRL